VPFEKCPTRVTAEMTFEKCHRKDHSEMTFEKCPARVTVEMTIEKCHYKGQCHCEGHYSNDIREVPRKGHRRSPRLRSATARVAATARVTAAMTFERCPARATAEVQDSEVPLQGSLQQ